MPAPPIDPTDPLVVTALNNLPAFPPKSVFQLGDYLVYVQGELDAGGGSVTSVNGQTGVVVLDAADVGAITLAESIAAAPVQSVNGFTGAVVLDAADVGADPAGAGTAAASAAIAAHVAAVDPHPQYTTVAEAAAAAPVQSVNGDVGAVVLTAADVGADPTGTAAAAVAAIPSDGPAATPSLRTLGTGSTQAAAGNDARFPVQGQATATFVRGFHSVSIQVADAAVTANARITATVGTGTRAADELELSPLVVGVGPVTAGVGFTLIVVSLDGAALGDYLVNYSYTR